MGRFVCILIIPRCVFLLTCIELQKNPVEGFSAGLVDDEDIYKWEVIIIGPPDTF